MALLTENPVLLRNEWLRFRQLSADHDESSGPPLFVRGMYKLFDFIITRLYIGQVELSPLKSMRAGLVVELLISFSR